MFQVVSLEAGEMAKLPEQTDGAKEPYPVPKELWFLCDIMTSLGLSKENLFLQVKEELSLMPSSMCKIGSKYLDTTIIQMTILLSLG